MIWFDLIFMLQHVVVPFLVFNPDPDKQNWHAVLGFQMCKACWVSGGTDKRLVHGLDEGDMARIQREKLDITIAHLHSLDINCVRSSVMSTS